MQAIKSLFDFYINSSIHVSLAVVSFAIISSIYLNTSPDTVFFFYLFFASITGYNFVKYAGIAKLHHSSLAKNLKIIQIFSLFAFIGLIFTAFQQSIEVLGVCAILGLITILYTIPVFSENTNLRGLTGVKIFIIAFVWAGSTVILPVINFLELLQWNVILHFLQIFCMLFVLILPFEIRDLKYDMVQLGTIPQQFGVRRTKLIGVGVLIIIVIMELLKKNITAVNSLSLYITCVVTIFALKFTTIRQPQYYSSFWIEAIPIFWLGVLLSLKFLFG